MHFHEDRRTAHETLFISAVSKFLAFVPRRMIYGLVLILLPMPLGSAQNKPATPIFKVKIEATELDRQMLLEKLNAHGADHHLKFALADRDFDYRIEFGTHNPQIKSGI